MEFARSDNALPSLHSRWWEPGVFKGTHFRVALRISYDPWLASAYRVAQNVVQGVIKGVTRASFGRRAPLTPQLKRASGRRREEKTLGGLQDSAGGECAPLLGTGTQS